MQKFVSLFFISIIYTGYVLSQSVDEMVKKGDLLEKQLNEEDAYRKFKEIIKIEPHHLYALTRCSELASRIGRRQPLKEQQMDYYTAAKIYAERALKINPYDSDANLVMALSHARMSLVKSGKEKVENVREIKIFAERSLAYNPVNFKAMFVIARWHYEVSNLSAIEKAAVKILFGGIQKNSVDSAVIYYERVRGINPEFVLNYLELAKAYNKANKRGKAIEILRYMLRLPNTAADDPTIKTEATQLLASWKS